MLFRSCYWWKPNVLLAPLYFKIEEYKRNCCVPLFAKFQIEYVVVPELRAQYVAKYIQWMTVYAKEHVAEMMYTLDVEDVTDALDEYYAKRHKVNV